MKIMTGCMAKRKYLFHFWLKMCGCEHRKDTAIFLQKILIRRFISGKKVLITGLRLNKK